MEILVILVIMDVLYVPPPEARQHPFVTSVKTLTILRMMDLAHLAIHLVRLVQLEALQDAKPVPLTTISMSSNA